MISRTAILTGTRRVANRAVVVVGATTLRFPPVSQNGTDSGVRGSGEYCRGHDRYLGNTASAMVLTIFPHGTTTAGCWY